MKMEFIFLNKKLLKDIITIDQNANSVFRFLI